MVERLQELLRDQVDDVRPGQADDDVEADRARGELRDRLVGGVVGRDLHLRPESPLELLDRRGIEVVGVVVEPKRAPLGRPALRDRPVLVGDRPRHGVVGARQRQPARSERPGDDELRGATGRASGALADGRGRVLAAGEHAGGADPERRARRAAEELSPGQSCSVSRMRHGPEGD